MEKEKRKPEILAPAGSFESAIYAFLAGADAVYFGLKSFSARKFAVNFNETQYKKLLNYSKKNNKKIYLTLNTIMSEDEITELIKTLKFLKFFTPDAIIIQDIGTIALIREYLGNIPIHLSTQAGSYSLLSYDILYSLKIKRIVLARECGLTDIIKLKNHYKNIEIEVFIHGALCYSFSGYCLASGLLLGRSGNKGECAQVCRNYFTSDKINKFKNCLITPFSCNDLNLNLDIMKLIKIGVDSFKIEGRMKSPEYTFYTVKHYRNMVDKYIENLDLMDNLKDSKSSFSRLYTKGYLLTSNGENLINPFFPSHLGFQLGKMLELNKNFLIVELKEKLTIKDGLLLIFKYDKFFMTFPFSVESIEINQKKVIKANKNQKAKIYSNSIFDIWKEMNKIKIFSNKEIQDLCTKTQNDFFIDYNIDIDKIINNNFILIRKISDRENDLKKINENTYEEFKYSIPIFIRTISSENFSNKNQLKKISLKYEYQILSNSYKDKIELEVYERTGNISYLEILSKSIISNRKEDAFEIIPNFDLSSLSILENIFIPPSINKRLINKMKDNINSQFNKLLNINFTKINSNIDYNFDYFINFKNSDIKDKKLNILSNLKKLGLITNNKFLRNTISPSNKIDNSIDSNLIPFVSFDNLKDLSILNNNSLCSKENFIFLPLNPIIMNEEIYSQRIENLINQNKNYIFILGINATWHFYLYKKLINNENTFFFFDFYIYIANKYSYLYYSKFDKVLFGFYYIEDAKLIESKIKTDDNFPLFEIFDFNPPLFISRGCLQRNLINSNKCSDNCRKKYLYEFKNQKKEFLYIIDECISYLFEKKP